MTKKKTTRKKTAATKQRLSKKKTPKLTPPDPKRCQAEKPNGNNFLTFGGPVGMVRCTEKPRLLVYEKELVQGERAGMSLCADCTVVFLFMFQDKLETYEFEEVGERKLTKGQRR